MYPAVIYGYNEEIGGVLVRDYVWIILRNTRISPKGCTYSTGSVLGMWVAVFAAKVLGGI